MAWIPISRRGLCDDAIGAAAVAFAEKRAAVELDLVGAVLADHRTLAAVAAEIGIRPKKHFTQEDLTLIYDAALTHQDQDEVAMLLAARTALKRESWWDEGQITGNTASSGWNDRRLVRLARSVPASKATVRRLSRVLLDLHQRQCEAEAGYKTCLSLLTDIDSPNGHKDVRNSRHIAMGVYIQRRKGNGVCRAKQSMTI